MSFIQHMDITLWGVHLGGVLVFLVKTLLIYAFTHGSVLIVRHLFRRSVLRRGRVLVEEHNIGFFQRIVVYVIYIVGGTAFLTLIPGMEQVSKSLLAGAGIMAMAVGLASQEALKNLVGGLFIVFSKPYRINDLIEVSNVKGTVEEITLRHTVIRSVENLKIIVPNSIMNSATIINSTIGDQATCAFVEIGIRYDADIDMAMRIMREEIEGLPQLIHSHRRAQAKSEQLEVVVRVVSLGSALVMLRAWAWAASADDAFILRCDALKAIKVRFDKEKISYA